MIKRLDNAITELRHYRAELDRNRWRSDIQSRIATIDNIEILIRSIYPSMGVSDDREGS